MAVKELERFVTDEVRASAPVLGKGSLAAIRARNRMGVGRGRIVERRETVANDSRSPLPASSSGLAGGLLVLTPGALLLIATRAAWIGHRATELICTIPLDQISGARLNEESGRLDLMFTDAPPWEFEVVKRDRPDALVLATALGRR